MSDDFVERLVAGQLRSRMTELEEELAAERATSGRLLAEVERMRAERDDELALADQLAEVLRLVANTWGVRQHVRSLEHAPVADALAAYEAARKEARREQ